MFVTGFIAENITNAHKSRPGHKNKKGQKCTNFRPITAIGKSKSFSTSSQPVGGLYERHIFVRRMPKLSICLKDWARHSVLDFFLVVYLKSVATKDLSQ